MKGIYQILMWVAAFVTFTLLCMIASGCSTRRCVPQIEYVTQDSIITRLRIDSVQVIERDSVFIDRAGDTVYLTKYKYIYKDRITNQTDTIYQDRVNNVVQTERIEVVPTYYRWCSWILWLLIAAGLIYAAYRIVRYYFLRR